MSFQATKFVIGLTDLTPSQKAVAHVFAYHADLKDSTSYPSMERVAQESGFKSRRTARRIVRQLEKRGLLIAASAKTGGRGRDKATVYRINLAYVSTEPASERRTAGTPFSAAERRTRTTIKEDLIGRKGGLPGPPNSQEQSGRVSEEQRPHTPTSKDFKGEEKSSIEHPADMPSLPAEIHCDSATGQRPSDPISSSPSQVYGSPAWLRKHLDAMPVEDKVAASLMRIPLNGDRRFNVNGKLKAVIGKWLAEGVPPQAILDAADEIAQNISPKDALPELTLASNLESVLVVRACEEVNGKQ